MDMEIFKRKSESMGHVIKAKYEKNDNQMTKEVTTPYGVS